MILGPLSPPVVTPDEIADARRHLGLGPDETDELLVYPGDLEFSGGAAAVARAAGELLAGRPGARLVFACRAKTPRAHAIAEGLRRELAPHGDRVRFAGQVPSLPALLAASRLVLFPVDDLYGKVDLPLSLLEAQSLGVPVVALQQGPLVELEGAVRLPSVDRLAAVCLEVLGDEGAWRQHRDQGQVAVARRHDPATIAAAYEDVYARL
ncbi:MAG: glycosyltransferase [Myxococcales bacterium]|nr:MAG: glycosyltransferase [Myxococcales bacterium]